MACLNLFLKELNDKKKEKYPYSSVNDCPTEYLLEFKTIFGMFPHFLLETREVKHSTAVNYIAQENWRDKSACTVTF